jgi:hypothetical protein
VTMMEKKLQVKEDDFGAELEEAVENHLRNL